MKPCSEYRQQYSNIADHTQRTQAGIKSKSRVNNIKLYHRKHWPVSVLFNVMSWKNLRNQTITKCRYDVFSGFSQYFPLKLVIFVRHLSYAVIREGTCELCCNNCKYLLTMTDTRGHSLMDSCVQNGNNKHY